MVVAVVEDAVAAYALVIVGNLLSAGALLHLNEDEVGLPVVLVSVTTTAICSAIADDHPSTLILRHP